MQYRIIMNKEIILEDYMNKHIVLVTVLLL